jgi:hypothetical protein
MVSDSFSYVANWCASTMFYPRQFAAVLAVVAHMWTSVALGVPISPQQVLGDWEITGLLVTDGSAIRGDL